MATKTNSVKALKVTSRPAVFRRAGLTFTGEPRTVPLSDLSNDQIKALEADPNLVVQRVEVDVAEPEAN